MVQAGIGGLDTPKTGLGDATYLSNQQYDFDISQEQSFQSPSKDNNNLVQQLQNGRRGAINLKTPRSRNILSDRRNLPGGLGGGEFTPLLKSATRNSALRNGKENIPQTPAFLRPGGLANIPEDLSPLPAGSVYESDSRNASYMNGTSIPQIDSSSAASTPMALLPRRNEGPGVLQDGNQLSLREQENVIDKIEKENFGLKLKIHFLEEALRKAGPGFSEAALKENTELKVDKVTMQKELHRYRKTLTAAERDVELYRQQILEMQEKVKRKHADEGQREELNRLRQALEERELELQRLRNQEDDFDNWREKVHDLEADLREKDRIVNDCEDEIENLKDEVEKQSGAISNLQESVKEEQRRNVELEEKAQNSEELEEAREDKKQLERDIKRLQEEVEEAKEDREEAVKERDRAREDLEELQDEMANKSITTKGLSRQIEEKANRIQDELEDLREKHVSLEEQHAEKIRELKSLQDRIEDLARDGEVREHKLQDRLEMVESEKLQATREITTFATKLDTLQKELQQKEEEKNLLQSRHDALTAESSDLQKALFKAKTTVENLEDKLENDKSVSLNIERELRDKYKEDMDHLNDEIEDLRAEVRKLERLHDDDLDKWEIEKRTLESERDRAEEHASGLQRTIDRLQEAEGTLSGKEMKLQAALQNEKERHEIQEAILSRQIEELNADIQSRRKAVEEVRSELLKTKEELRLSQREQKNLAEKVEALEDEIEVLQTNLDDETDRANQDLSAVRQESDSLRRQLHEAKIDLANAESAAANARAELEAFQGDLQTGDRSTEKLSSRFRELEGQLSRVRQEKQSMHDQLANIQVEMHSLRVAKAEAEAERDEAHSELRAMKQQEEETFRLDQERIDLRTAKAKLDAEVRRLREENKAAIANQQAAEKELEDEIEKASNEDARLNAEILDLQKILRGSSEKRELATAKKTIQNLEDRICELEARIASADDHDDVRNELSMVRRDLSAARQKETEFVQREAAQKDILRGLKRQITDLEWKAQSAEISRQAISPQSSSSGSARKSEIAELRTQLATTHQSLKDLRTQLKETEKTAVRKVYAANVDLRTRQETWEAEKDHIEHSLEQALLEKDDLAAKNASSESSITRLRSKIDRLEKALHAERLNSGEDRTMALERRDLHSMLRETQLQAESLEVIVQERENAIAAITASESDLRAQLKRVRDERAQHRSKAVSAVEQLDAMERRFRRAEKAWENEKKTLCKGVRFPNMSLSVNDEQEVAGLRKEVEEREKRHVKELRGMAMQVEWLRARCKREEGFRASAAYAKKYMGLQIELFEACNKADLALIRSAGITIERPKIEKKPSFRVIAQMVRATVRMKRGAEQWAESRKVHEKLVTKRELMRRQAVVQGRSLSASGGGK